MSRVKLSIAVGIAVTTGSYAFAQSLPDVATDRELYAGFCLGVRNEFVEDFRQYLQARGLLPGARSTNAVAGILLARKRGERAELICDARISVCVNKCFVSRDDRCIEDCKNEEPNCISISRCSDTSKLPF
jgi:hypothetical protein